MKNSLEIADQCLVRVRELLRNRAGILLQSHQLEQLRNYIHHVCITQKMSACEEYIEKLEQMPAHSKIFDDLIATVTIGESYFFRDNVQMNFLRNVWLPHIIHQREKEGQRFLRVWSAGCASGQEIYSIAIMLKENLPDLGNWKIHLLGTDINTNQLSQAAKGWYTEKSLQTLNSSLKKRYFKKLRKNCYRLDSSIRNIVTFRYHNLMQMDFPSTYAQTNALDLILCRNVFIYFDKSSTRSVVERFANCLIPGGYLILGPADFTSDEVTGLELQYKKEVFFYERQIYDDLDFISTPEQTIEQVEEVKKPGCTAKPKIDEHYVKELFDNSAWREVVSYIDQHKIETLNALIYKARALANLGRLKEALEVCKAYLEKEALNAMMYLLQGLIYIDLLDLDAAERSLRQTLFLDPNCFEAEYQLGVLLLRKGQRRKGIKLLRSILKKIDHNKWQHESIRMLNENMQCEQFKDILSQEIRIYDKE